MILRKGTLKKLVCRHLKKMAHSSHFSIQKKNILKTREEDYDSDNQCSDDLSSENSQREPLTLESVYSAKLIPPVLLKEIEQQQEPLKVVVLETFPRIIVSDGSNVIEVKLSNCFSEEYDRPFS